MQALERTFAPTLLRYAAVLLMGVILLSACSHTEVKEDPATSDGLYAFKIVVDKDSEQGKTLSEAQRTFLEVSEDGTITTQGDRVLGKLLNPLSIGKEGKLVFRLTAEGTIENDRGQVLDAQIVGDTLSFKGFMNDARMSLIVEDEALFVSLQTPSGRTEKRSVGRITPYRQDRNDRVLWLAHYSLLQSFQLLACKAKQNMASMSLMLVRQQQEIFRLENERYGRSLTEIAFQRNNPHYTIELLPGDDDAHYIAKATSVPTEDATDKMLEHADVWTIDQAGALKNTHDACR